jgi:hypothetical protein
MKTPWRGFAPLEPFEIFLENIGGEGNGDENKGNLRGESQKKQVGDGGKELEGENVPKIA